MTRGNLPNLALFIGEHPDAKSMFSLIVERDFGLLCQHAINGKQAKDMLEQSPEDYALCIYLLPDKFSDEFVNFAKNLPQEIPIMFTSDDAHLNLCVRYVSTYPIASRISFNLDWKVVSASIMRLLRILGRKERDLSSYCPLDSQLFLRLDTSPYDLYLKLSDDKMLLVFRKGTQILPSDIEKYKIKDHPHFYLKAPDYLNALDIFLDKIQSSLLKIAETHEDKLAPIAVFTHKNMRQMIQKLGLSDTAISMANTSIQSIHKLIKNNGKIAENFMRFMTRKNYLSEHCLAIPFVVAGMAEFIPGLSNADLEKITFAATFHDIGLEDVNLAQIRQIDEALEHNIGSRKLTLVRQHPTLSVELINKLDGVPSDVEKIILQHHERPDGKGFPHGLDYKKISPHAAIFIVAEEFISSIYESGLNKVNVDAVMDDLQILFQKGNFLVAFRALEKAVGHGPLKLISQDTVS